MFFSILFLQKRDISICHESNAGPEQNPWKTTRQSRVTTRLLERGKEVNQSSRCGMQLKNSHKSTRSFFASQYSCICISISKFPPFVPYFSLSCYTLSLYLKSPSPSGKFLLHMLTTIYITQSIPLFHFRFVIHLTELLFAYLLPSCFSYSIIFF